MPSVTLHAGKSRHITGPTGGQGADSLQSGPVVRRALRKEQKVQRDLHPADLPLRSLHLKAIISP